MGDLSAHFSRAEFAEHDNGALPPAFPAPQLVIVLERIRALTGKPLRIVSGYRSVEYNRRIGGARNSRHTHGDAADIEPGHVTVLQAVACGATGIGWCGNWVVHVDTRPLPAGTQPVIFRDC